jgi:hypothetical protein
MLHGQCPGASQPPPPPPPGGVAFRHPQLEQFNAEMSRLGSHPDKDTILRATTIAKQHSQDLAKEIVELLQARVLSVSGFGFVCTMWFVYVCVCGMGGRVAGPVCVLSHVY